jgi:hypothetical protein
MWTCPKCLEKVDPSFDVCWNCGTAADGTEDPHFQTADEAGPIDDPAVDGDLGVDSLDALSDEFAEPLPELVDCYTARSEIEAKFLADRLREQGIPAVSDRHNMNMMALGGIMPEAWGYGPRIRVRPEDLGRAQTWLAGFEKHIKARRTQDGGDSTGD